MSRRNLTPDDWRRAVYAARVSDRTKVVLLFLADHMRSNFEVSVPRSRVAAAVGKTDRRVTECITEATKAGLLYTVQRGQKHLTAVYSGTFPDKAQGADSAPAEEGLSGSSTSPLRSAETRPLRSPNQALRGRTSRPPYIERTPSVGGDDRYGGNYEEVDGDRAPSSTTGCPDHWWDECPEDCRNHPQTGRASA